VSLVVPMPDALRAVGHADWAGLDQSQCSDVRAAYYVSPRGWETEAIRAYLAGVPVNVMRAARALGGPSALADLLEPYRAVRP
jgi:hypothetical protein